MKLKCHMQQDKGVVATEKAQRVFSELEAWKNQKSGTWNENAWPD